MFGTQLRLFDRLWTGGLSYCFLPEANRLKTLKSYLGFGLGALGILYGIGVSYRYFMLNTYWQRSLSMSEILRGLLPLQIPKDILCCLLLAWIFAKRDQLCRKKRWQSEADRERREPSRASKGRVKASAKRRLAI